LENKGHIIFGFWFWAADIFPPSFLLKKFAYLKNFPYLCGVKQKGEKTVPENRAKHL